MFLLLRQMPQSMPSLMQFNDFLLKNASSLLRSARETKNVTGNSLRNARETKNVTDKSLRNASRTMRTSQL